MFFINRLRGIVWYELILHWRQRGLLIFGLCLLCITIFSITTVHAQIETLNAALSHGQLSEADALNYRADILNFATWPVNFMLILLLVPMITADAIPRDRHFGINDLLESTPLSMGTYLLSKTLSIMIGVLVAVALVALGVGIGFWALVGPYTLQTYAAQWALTAAPLALVQPALCMLFASGQKTRRMALVAGFAAVVLSLYFLVSGISTLGHQPNLADYLNPAHVIALMYYSTSNVHLPNLTETDVWLTWFGAFIDLVLMGLIAGLWLQRQKA
jgi:ABC-type transport system involved in multi-copper enzyme maturation permease subunit